MVCLSVSESSKVFFYCVIILCTKYVRKKHYYHEVHTKNEVKSGLLGLKKLIKVDGDGSRYRLGFNNNRLSFYYRIPKGFSIA